MTRTCVSNVKVLPVTSKVYKWHIIAGRSTCTFSFSISMYWSLRLMSSILSLSLPRSHARKRWSLSFVSPSHSFAPNHTHTHRSTYTKWIHCDMMSEVRWAENGNSVLNNESLGQAYEIILAGLSNLWVSLHFHILSQLPSSVTILMGFETANIFCFSLSRRLVFHEEIEEAKKKTEWRKGDRVRRGWINVMNVLAFLFCLITHFLYSPTDTSGGRAPKHKNPDVDDEVYRVYCCTYSIHCARSSYTKNVVLHSIIWIIFIRIHCALKRPIQVAWRE